MQETGSQFARHADEFQGSSSESLSTLQSGTSIGSMSMLDSLSGSSSSILMPRMLSQLERNRSRNAANKPPRMPGLGPDLLQLKNRELGTIQSVDEGQHTDTESIVIEFSIGEVSEESEQASGSNVHSLTESYLNSGSTVSRRQLEVQHLSDSHVNVRVTRPRPTTQSQASVIEESSSALSEGDRYLQLENQWLQMHINRITSKKPVYTDGSYLATAEVQRLQEEIRNIKEQITNARTAYHDNGVKLEESLAHAKEANEQLAVAKKAVSSFRKQSRRDTLNARNQLDELLITNSHLQLAKDDTEWRASRRHKPKQKRTFR